MEKINSKPSTNKSLTILYTKPILFAHCDVKYSSIQSSLSLFSIKRCSDDGGGE